MQNRGKPRPAGRDGQIAHPTGADGGFDEPFVLRRQLEGAARQHQGLKR